MKKIYLIIICFLLFANSTKSQIIPTVGEIYDYSVGDEFISRDIVKTLPFLNNYSEEYVGTTITGKYYSAALDTVFYNCTQNTMFLQWTYPGTAAPYTTATYSTQSPILSYTNLTIGADSLANFPSFYTTNNFPDFSDPCYLGVHDSVYLGYCSSKRYFKRNFVWGPTCFEPYATIFYMVEGCGGPYRSYNNTGSGFTYNSNLIFYKKGTDSCGTRMSLLAGMNDFAE